MPADPTEFLAKRAALQGTEKTAKLPLGIAKNMFGGLGKKIFSGLGKKIVDNPGKAALIGGTAIALNELASPTVQNLAKRIQRTVIPTIREREKLDEETAISFAQSLGEESGKQVVGLLSDTLSKAVQAPIQFFGNKSRASVFNLLQKEDDVLSRANPQELAESYHTMTRFAPTLATDKNAVKTFLREAILYGTGPNIMAIKQLAEAENVINPQPQVKKSR